MGQFGTITSLTPAANMTPGELIKHIRQHDPDIILLDGPVPPNTQAVRRLANEYPVLEPHSELVPSQDPDGPAAVRVRRLGRRNHHGGIEPLCDEALSS